MKSYLMMSGVLGVLFSLAVVWFIRKTICMCSIRCGG